MICVTNFESEAKKLISEKKKKLGQISNKISGIFKCEQNLTTR